MSLLVFDIGGQSVKYALWSNEAISEKSSFNTPRTWEELKQEMHQAFLGLNSKYTISGVAISCPGSVDSEKGIIKGISALPYIHNFNIIEEWEKLFKLPISIENDANAAALAELSYGVAKQAENVVFIVIGSGIGGSVAINGELLKGKHLFTGEIGYMLLDKDNTLSNLASSLHQINRHNKNSPDHRIKDGIELFELAKAGNKEAESIVNEIYDSLAQGIYNISVMLDPDLIAIGGGISIRKDIVNQLTIRVNNLLDKQGASDIKPNILTCKFYNDANLIGAAENFQRKFGNF